MQATLSSIVCLLASPHFLMATDLIDFLFQVSPCLTTQRNRLCLFANSVCISTMLPSTKALPQGSYFPLCSVQCRTKFTGESQTSHLEESESIRTLGMQQMCTPYHQDISHSCGPCLPSMSAASLCLVLKQHRQFRQLRSDFIALALSGDSLPRTTRTVNDRKQASLIKHDNAINMGASHGRVTLHLTAIWPLYGSMGGTGRSRTATR
jgi:hypothetical protein